MKHQKLTQILTVVLFVLPLLVGLVLFLALPDQAFSAEENRSLKQLPKLTWSSLTAKQTERKFSSQMNEYFADQFPVRDLLVGIKGVAELAMGKQGNNGVVLGKDGVLAVRWFDALLNRTTRVTDTDYYAKDAIAAQTATLNKLSADLAAQGIPLTVLIPPRTLDVYAEQLRYPDAAADAIWAELDAGLDESVQYVDLREVMQQATARGEYVYYRTDHHWTTQGAYLAYGALMSAWGREADLIPESAFEVETIEGFHGTTWSRAGFKFVAPDTLEIWHFEQEGIYTVFDPEQKRGFSGFYNRDYLAQKDKYSVFLDGTHGILTVTKDVDQERPRLLVFKDSFFNSMVPFLAQHYDLVVVNLSLGVSQPLSAYVEQYGCDGILVVYNAENIIESNAITTLTYQK